MNPPTNKKGQEFRCRDTIQRIATEVKYIQNYLLIDLLIQKYCQTSPLSMNWKPLFD